MENEILASGTWNLQMEQKLGIRAIIPIEWRTCEQRTEICLGLVAEQKGD